METKKYIISIDPGNEESAYAFLEADTLKPVYFAKKTNDECLEDIEKYITQIQIKNNKSEFRVVIEMIASYGMAVGKTVFDTCVWIGVMKERRKFWTPVFVYRKDEKMNLCHSMKANDSNIRQALIDRFGEVGTKKSPGWFYGVKKDIWAAIAVGVTYSDMLERGEFR